MVRHPHLRGCSTEGYAPQWSQSQGLLMCLRKSITSGTDEELPNSAHKVRSHEGDLVRQHKDSLGHGTTAGAEPVSMVSLR